MIIYCVEHISKHPILGLRAFLKAEEMEDFFISHPDQTFRVVTLMDEEQRVKKLQHIKDINDASWYKF